MNDDALPSDTKELLRNAKDAWTPSEADRARNERALLLATAAASTATATAVVAASSATTKSTALMWIAKAAIATTVLSATAFVAYGIGYREGISARITETRPVGLERTNTPGVVVTQTATEATRPMEPHAPTPSEPHVARTSPRASEETVSRRAVPRAVAEVPEIEAATPLEQSDLAREVETLRRARVALEGGSNHLALEWLGRYRTEFPSGALSREASILRIRVLCALDRRSEAAETLRLSGNDSLTTDAFTSTCRGRE